MIIRLYAPPKPPLTSQNLTHAWAIAGFKCYIYIWAVLGIWVKEIVGLNRCLMRLTYGSVARLSEMSPKHFSSKLDNFLLETSLKISTLPYFD